jgi:hypothetical protein
VSSTINTKVLKRLRQLFAMLGSSNANERETTRRMIDDLLAKHRKTWNDFVELMQSGSADSWEAAYDDNCTAEQATGDAIDAGLPEKAAKLPDALELTRFILQEYVDLKAHEYIAVALWVLLTHVYDHFTISPRLAATSPVNGCGKTTLLATIERLAFRPQRMDNATPAVIYHLIDRLSGTLLVDEADNLGLGVNGVLRGVLNSGHRQGGNIRRLIRGAPKTFSTYAPMAIAAIGSLPMPLMRRSIIVHMEKATAGNIKRFDLGDAETRRRIDIVYRFVLDWARNKPALDLNPPLPKDLRNRVADNWRPLIAIADGFGPYWAQAAREAAVIFARTFHDEDAGVVLLSDLRDIFNRTGANRMASADLITALLDIEESGWDEYRGMRDDQAARKLTPGEMARLLRPFGIRPRSIWPQAKRREGDTSRKGYHRTQFESAWQRYCSPAAGTTAQANVIGDDR